VAIEEFALDRLDPVAAFLENCIESAIRTQRLSVKVDGVKTRPAA